MERLYIQRYINARAQMAPFAFIISASRVVDRGELDQTFRPRRCAEITVWNSAALLGIGWPGLTKTQPRPQHP
jgi:hypothetical protein